jgi:hypothetical protein
MPAKGRRKKKPAVGDPNDPRGPLRLSETGPWFVFDKRHGGQGADPGWAQNDRVIVQCTREIPAGIEKVRSWTSSCRMH